MRMPIAVEEAKPGDAFVVGVEKIRLTEAAGRVVTIDGCGLLDGEPQIETPETRMTPENQHRCARL